MTDLETDRSYLLPDDDPADQITRPLVEQVQGGAVGLEQVGQAPQDQLQQIVELEGRTERVSDLAQRPGNPLLASECLPQLRELASISRIRTTARHCLIESWTRA